MRAPCPDLTHPHLVELGYVFLELWTWQSRHECLVCNLSSFLSDFLYFLPKIVLSSYCLSGTVLGRGLIGNTKKGALFFLVFYALISTSYLLSVCASSLGGIMDSWRHSMFWSKRDFGEPYLTNKETCVCGGGIVTSTNSTTTTNTEDDDAKLFLLPGLDLG